MASPVILAPSQRLIGERAVVRIRHNKVIAASLSQLHALLTHDMDIWYHWPIDIITLVVHYVISPVMGHALPSPIDFYNMTPRTTATAVSSGNDFYSGPSNTTAVMHSPTSLLPSCVAMTSDTLNRSIWILDHHATLFVSHTAQDLSAQHSS